MHVDLTSSLREAVSAGRPNGVRTLLFAGVDVDAIVLIPAQWTSLHLAVALLARDIASCRPNVAARRAVVDVLLAHGADPWRCDVHGDNAGALAGGLAMLAGSSLRQRIADETEAQFHDEFYDENGNSLMSRGVPRLLEHAL